MSKKTKAEKKKIAKYAASRRRWQNRNDAGIASPHYDQAFLVAFLNTLVETRKETEKSARLANRWVYVDGEISSFADRITSARTVDAFANMNAAQASLLVPLIRLEKIPTPELKAAFPDLPDYIPIVFPTQSGDVIGYGQRKTAEGRMGWMGWTMQGQVGIKSIHVRELQKNPSSSESTTVDMVFAFDSLETFTENQAGGIKFLDLIPTQKSEQWCTAHGIKGAVKYNLSVTLGWQIPPDAGALFVGSRGEAIKQAIEDTQKTYILQSGGKHDVVFMEDGGVELTVTYRARSGVGEHYASELDSDILGGNVTIEDVENLKEEINKKKERIEAIKVASAKRSNEIKRLDKELQEAADALLQAKHAAINAMEDGKLNAFHESEQRPAVDNSTVKGMGDLIGAHFKIKQAQAKARQAMEDPDAQLWVEGEPLYDEYQAASQKKKQANMKHKEAQKKDAQKDEEDAYEINLLKDQIRDLYEDPDFSGTRLQSIVSALFQRGFIHFHDIMGEHVKKRVHHKKYASIVEKQAKTMMGRNYKGGAAADYKKVIQKYNLEKSKAPERRVRMTMTDEPVGTDHRIHYFYLGDLIDVIVGNWHDNMGGRLDKRFEHNSVLLSNFYYKKKSGRKAKAHPINMGDFPIALNYFLDFFTDRFVRRSAISIGLEEFLDEMVRELFTRPAFQNIRNTQKGPFLDARLPKQHWDIKVFNLQSTERLEWGVRSMATGKGSPKSRMTYKLGGPPDKLDIPIEKELSAAAEAGVSSKEFANTAAWRCIDASLDNVYTYYALGPATSPATKVPSYSIYLGSSTSFIKSVKYKLISGKQRSGAGGRGKGKDTRSDAAAAIGVRDSYSVALETMGAPFFQLFQRFELNNDAMLLRLSDYEADEFLPRLLTVGKLEHKYDSGDFTTSVEARISDIGVSFAAYKTDPVKALNPNNKENLKKYQKKKGGDTAETPDPNFTNPAKKAPQPG